jgi:hypothetical protein
MNPTRRSLMKKSHWISLIILLVLFGIYIVARHSVRIEQEVRFFKADSVDIARIELISPEDTIVVSKSGNQWKLKYPLAWEVNEQQLSSFFNQVLSAKTSSIPMSEDPNQHSVYKVDEKSAIQVKLYDKQGKLLDHVYIGNGTDTTFDYGRKQGDKDTYQFKDTITNFVRPDLALWRSNNILNLKQVQIDHIDITYPHNSYTLAMVGDSIRYTDKHKNFMIPSNNRAQFKIINALENMMTWQFQDKNTEQYTRAFQHPDCHIVITLKNKEIRTITLIDVKTDMTPAEPNQTGEQPLILLMLDNKPAPLYQMSADFLNRFTRAAEHFQTEYD